MSIELTLNPEKLEAIREMDPRVQSYNIEMTELTGGTFWVPYTPEQISGEEAFPTCDKMEDMMKMLAGMQTKVPAINLYDEKIRSFAKAFGPVVIRFSGSWATRTYYDFDGHTGGKAPEGFEFVLTKEQWQGALDFVKAVNGQILVSVANSFGVHEDHTGAWMPEQAELLWKYTEEQGMKIEYAEFMNEPNMLNGMCLPDGYTLDDYGRDYDLFAKWLRENHPETKLVGPCSAENERGAAAGGMAALLLGTEDIMKRCKEAPDYYSYHSYNGISERGQMFGAHFDFDAVTSEYYLGATMEDLHYNEAIRDKYAPGAEMWVTESADAACGGNTWGPTFVETIRYVDELARFNVNTRGIIFHNTLASSAYGLLDADTHMPRPQYWGALLYSRLAGTTVYDTKEEIREGAHVYAQSRKDGEKGFCYVIINNSREEETLVHVPACVQYTLSADSLRSQEIKLNGNVIASGEDGTIPELKGEEKEAGTITLAPCTVTYLVVGDER